MSVRMTKSQRSQERRGQAQLGTSPVTHLPHIPTIGLGSVVMVEDLDTNELDTNELEMNELEMNELEMVQVVLGQDPLTSVRATTGEFVNAPLDAPFGRALVGHKVGDLINVTAPWGSTAYRVIDFDAAAKPGNGRPFCVSVSNDSSARGATYRCEGANIEPLQGRKNGAQLDIPQRDECDLDGGKFIGFLAREGGSFGSYPGYDNMGDESSP